MYSVIRQKILSRGVVSISLPVLFPSKLGWCCLRESRVNAATVPTKCFSAEAIKTTHYGYNFKRKKFDQFNSCSLEKFVPIFLIFFCNITYELKCQKITTRRWPYSRTQADE